MHGNVGATVEHGPLDFHGEGTLATKRSNRHVESLVSLRFERHNLARHTNAGETFGDVRRLQHGQR